MPYPSIKVQALLDGVTSIDGTWTAGDFADLALAALDQAGVSAMHQSRIAELVAIDVPDECEDDESPVARVDGPRCECGLLVKDCAVAGPANHESRLAPDVGF